MNFPGSLNNPSFLKPQITSEGFFHRKYFTIFFQHLQSDSLRLQEKGNDWWKIGKSPPFLFFNQMLHLKVKGMKEARYAQQLTVKCIKLAIYTMIQWLISFKTAVSSVATFSTSTSMDSGTYLKLALEEHVTCLRNEVFQRITSVLSKVQKSDHEVQTNRSLTICCLCRWRRECRSLLHIILPSHPSQVSEVI